MQINELSNQYYSRQNQSEVRLTNNIRYSSIVLFVKSTQDTSISKYYKGTSLNNETLFVHDPFILYVKVQSIDLS